MELKFFEYKKNCKEFTILKKATSKIASRADLKKGQLLFNEIYKNIVIISSKLDSIESSIIQRTKIISKTKEKENIFPHEFKLKYPINNNINFEDRFSRVIENEQDKFIHYYNTVEASIHSVQNYLESNFDHEELNKKIKDLEKEKHKNKGFKDSFKQNSLQFYKKPIANSIIEILEHYSCISSKLLKYFNLFIEIENIENEKLLAEIKNLEN
jgi:hypothetical protein